MLTEQQIELAHPEAFDFVFGTLPTAEGVKFIRHLTGCSHCRAVVDEYSEIGEIIKQLPPHAEPPAGLEDRTVAAMTAALAEHKAEPDGHPDAADHDAEDRAVTRIYPKPERTRPAEQQTRVLPVPRPGPPESRSPGRRSPTCQCGGVTAAAWSRPLPPQPPSSSPRSSSRSALPVARPPPPKPPLLSPFMPPRRPRSSGPEPRPHERQPARPARAGRSI